MYKATDVTRKLPLHMSKPEILDTAVLSCQEAVKHGVGCCKIRISCCLITPKPLCAGVKIKRKTRTTLFTCFPWFGQFLKADIPAGINGIVQNRRNIVDFGNLICHLVHQSTVTATLYVPVESKRTFNMLRILDTGTVLSLRYDCWVYVRMPTLVRIFAF